MRVLVAKWFGVVVLDGDRVVERRDFPREVHAIADRLRRMRAGEVLEEERALAKPGVALTEDRQRPLGTVRPLEAPVRVDPAGADPKLLRDAAMLIARDEAKSAMGERDRFVVQSVRALDEIHKTVNTLMERLREWYALHYPESLRDPGDPAKFARALADAPDRAALAKRLGFAAPEDSIGAEFDATELHSIRAFAQTLLGLFTERDRLEARIMEDARVVAPTLSTLVGPLIAARLISQSGGLERLAHFPASTVQTLGAENALFMHRKEDKPPPKHGVLFQHPLVNTAARWHRGKVARVLATHASIASRLDFFIAAPTDRSKELKASLDKAVARIRAAPRPAPKPFNRRPPPRDDRSARKAKWAPKPKGGFRR